MVAGNLSPASVEAGNLTFSVEYDGGAELLALCFLLLFLRGDISKKI